MNGSSLYDLGPALTIALLGLLLAGLPLAWWWRRHRDTTPSERLRALTLLILFLTFDLVLVGSFTRLTDSGLGCPDWPGCYGHASPLGAQAQIQAAQTAQPVGPVTHGKAWVEMLHRYLATGVGALITVLAVASWLLQRRGRTRVSPWWPTATLLWVCAQGAFGALTVTTKLVPAIVTLHLLGGIGLLVLLALQSRQYVSAPLRLSEGLWRGTWAVAALVLLQITLGGWVSTNYAVLACSEFPTCQGSWWPTMEFGHGFTLWRDLGTTRAGDYLPFAALTAIHVTHRLVAIVVLAALLLLAWRLRVSGDAALRRFATLLAGLSALQLLTGLANVVLGWPLLAAVVHAGGAAALLTALALLLARAAQARPRRVAAAGATFPTRAASRP